MTRIQPRLWQISVVALLALATACTPPGNELIGVRIEPASPTIGVGACVQLSATAEFEDGSEQDVTDDSVWTSLDTAVSDGERR